VNVSGERSFGAPRDVVWDVLNDPKRMAAVMPGIERFEVEDEQHWTAHVLIPLGLGGLRMRINFEKTEQREPEYARLHAKGEGVGALVNMDTQFRLEEESGGTAMRWEADVRIAGPVGSMGQRVLQPIVNQQVKMVLNAVDEQVLALARARREGGAGDSGADAAGAAGVAGDPPQTGEFIAGSEEAPPDAPPPQGSEEAARWGEAGTSGMGTSSTPEPTAEREPPATDATLRDAGPPADVGPEADPGEIEGSSGAEEGVSPWDPDAYSPRPEGEDPQPTDERS
jgi:carbon monoxide dehydrogenase subunit G